MWERTHTIFVESLERALTATARVAPGLVALLIVFAVAAIGALLVRVGVQRLCVRLELDRWAVRWGLASAEAGRIPPSVVVTRLATWTVLAFGLLLGVAIFDAAAKTALASRLADYAPHVFAAALIAVVGAAAARALERQLLIGAVNFGFQSARLLAAAVRWIVVVAAVAMALDHLGIGGSVLPIFCAVAGGGVALGMALAFGLGARDAVARAVERRAKQGDDVQHM
jgi:hypothetical protein